MAPYHFLSMLYKTQSTRAIKQLLWKVHCLLFINFYIYLHAVVGLILLALSLFDLVTVFINLL
jgi:hypothetical protein